MGKARLSFYINQGLLTGEVDGKTVYVRAASGGGGGTKSPKGPDEWGTVNNPFKTAQKKDSNRNVRGGPLPPGDYHIARPAHHPRLGLAAALIPGKGNHMGHRGGFFIHGRGKHGSDGCIVPLNPVEFQHLMHGLAKDDGGALRVHTIADVVPTGKTMFA